MIKFKISKKTGIETVSFPSKPWTKLSEINKISFLQNQDRIIQTMKTLNPKSVVDGKKKRIGVKGDGGYVVLENLLDKGNIAYSIGIGKSDHFEQAIEKYGYHIWMYDHTVNAKRFMKPTRTIKKIGIGDKNDGPLRTLRTLLKENGHENESNMILQMDTEGAEWPVFSKINPDSLLGFSQIILEIHWLNKMFASQAETYVLEQALKRLTKNHTVFHVHGNNYTGWYEIKNKPPLCDVLEISLVRNDLVEFIDCDETFPTKFDSPNRTGAADIQLGTFQW